MQTLTVDQDNTGWNIHYLTFGRLGRRRRRRGSVRRYARGGARHGAGGQLRHRRPGPAYNVTAVNGSANSYRSDGVDLEASTDTGGGYDIGWTAAGQWFKYTVNVATAGTYTLSLRLAAPTAVTDAPAHRQRRGHQPERQRHRPGDRRLPELDHGHRQRHPARGRADLTVHQDNAGWNIHYLAFAPPAAADGGSYGGFPSGFWGNTSSIPSASGAIEFDFLNATNGAVPRQRGLLGRQRRRGVDRPVAVLHDDRVQLLPDLLLPRLAQQPVLRLHRAELQRHDDQRRHLAGRRVPAAAGHPPAQLRRHRHRGRRGRPGVRREQDRPVPAVPELRTRRRSSSSPP